MISAVAHWWAMGGNWAHGWPCSGYHSALLDNQFHDIWRHFRRLYTKCILSNFKKNRGVVEKSRTNDPEGPSSKLWWGNFFFFIYFLFFKSIRFKHSPRLFITNQHVLTCFFNNQAACQRRVADKDTDNRQLDSKDIETNGIGYHSWTVRHQRAPKMLPGNTVYEVLQFDSDDCAFGVNLLWMRSFCRHIY